MVVALTSGTFDQNGECPEDGLRLQPQMLKNKLKINCVFFF